MSSSNWPPPSRPSTPTISHQDRVFYVCASTTVSAPASVVFDAVLRVADYHQWNSFIPVARILQQPPSKSETDVSSEDVMRLGSIMEFHAVMNSAKPNSKNITKLLVSDISTPEEPTEYIDASTRQADAWYTSDLTTVHRVSWKEHEGYPGLRAERFHEVIARGDAACEVRTWEVMGGLLSYAVKFLFQKTLDEKFVTWCQELKHWSEKKFAEGTAQ